MKDIRFTKKKVDQSWKETITKDNNVNEQPNKTENNDLRATTEKKEKNETQYQSNKVNFTSFLSSLAMQALIHIGEIPNPITQTKEINLAAASELIDLISMIENKTKGNLNADEDKMIKAILYDIRIRYVEKSKENSAS